MLLNSHEDDRIYELNIKNNYLVSVEKNTIRHFHGVHNFWMKKTCFVMASRSVIYTGVFDM